ncbi:uncharacterized protein DNG_04627 [Cephalotrichum gorgonifer]|uniref:Uncharacterized protein n=1 Tax=Cephalotrichum gorgonifer TaxID=2041049 RepID=A0AAE8MYB0_9PEZI|nr:uncharacterized protein DNG_04627 [Cephalotrichum gorgonifer]
MLNHCVSVSISKILAYSDVHEFWQDNLGGSLPDTPLSVHQTVELIASTGWTVTWKVYLPWNGNSACRNLQLDPKFHAGAFRAVAYTQKGRVGHCVTSGLLRHKYPMTLPMSYPSFMCYQRDKNGIDVSHEVEAAENVFVFHLQCPEATPQWYSWQDRVFRRMVERRGTDAARQAQYERIWEHLRTAGLLETQPRASN